MSDTVDNVLDAVSESEPAEVVVSEATDPVEEAPEEVASAATPPSSAATRFSKTSVVGFIKRV